MRRYQYLINTLRKQQLFKSNRQIAGDLKYIINVNNK